MKMKSQKSSERKDYMNNRENCNADWNVISEHLTSRLKIYEKEKCSLKCKGSQTVYQGSSVPRFVLIDVILTCPSYTFS